MKMKIKYRVVATIDDPLTDGDTTPVLVFGTGDIEAAKSEAKRWAREEFWVVIYAYPSGEALYDSAPEDAVR